MFTGYRKKGGGGGGRPSLSVLFAFCVCGRTLRAIIFVCTIWIHQANCASPQDLSAICPYSSFLDHWEFILACQYQFHKRYRADCEGNKLSCRFHFANERQNCSRSCRKIRTRFPLYVQKTTMGVDLSLTCKQGVARHSLSRFFLSLPAFHAGLATCGRLLALNSVALPKGFPPSLLSGSLALCGFSS